MSGHDTTWTAPRIIEGEIRDDSICVRLLTGQLLRLRKDAPPHQRASFFDRVFAEMAPRGPWVNDDQETD